MSKNIVAILISIVIVFFLVKDFGFIFISLPIFVLLSYNLSNLILQFSSKKLNKRKTKNFEWIFLIPLFIILIFGRYFENTVGGYELFWKSAFASLIFSSSTVYILSLYYNFSNDKPKINNVLSLSIFFLLLMPSLSIYINYRFSISPDRKEIVEINEKYINNGSKGGKSYEIFIKTRFDTNERLEISREFYDEISNINQNVELTLSKGVLGYDYVKKIEKH
ncbi:hypothetical protein [Chryseobacterium sp. Hurlbut01]|uniref:hypothetical protein n=1 Tax=Chryseobacterium sp. Hurlbut01 TaxID=1681828 RepID=UPI00067E1D98|nr:hypothetical protein [Chryseobacterium sp. Hurlbut01]KNB61439.1 hypothetical protein AC804_08715 [Chryseobacterium sp. Hurlbut01]